MKKRIYICHTYYHVYIACLKELNLPEDVGGAVRGQASLMLSSLSNDFGTLKERAEKSGLFEEVIPYEEKREDFFPELSKYHKDRGNILLNMLARIKFTRLMGKLQAPFVPVDLHEYQDIYVFCDSDPIGYYLNVHKIYYHALEDGLDCICYYDTARYDNRGHFGLKAWMAARNIIFIQNGYAKYCLDMEVNDISVLKYPCPKYIEVPRKSLVEGLREKEKEMLVSIFVAGKERLEKDLSSGLGHEHKVLVLSEPLCDLETRERIFKDIIAEYGYVEGQKAQILIKPHPRDVLDYEKLFSEYIVLDGKFPMEILNYFPNLVFDRVVTVFTVPDAILFAKEKIYLGEDFMDKYEAPKMHRQNELIE
ncbi:glycosyltransferase family 52 [Parablautia muri]|uniref:Lipooligosaccharide sialyltransferase n=1 Tax=Parablautia muri TaxID=2320879 RepID=A0A9X5BCK0_9FIRM|nr:glycosyltransferase family 52 [Parablautia muri]NBJ91266.1 lipooligosaccharide sialyltransferase [Parablautia muri]